jgi:hypothetical protein
MKKRILFAAITILAITVSSYTYLAGTDNTLTESEKKAGWKLLFDGKSLTGWRPYQNRVTNSWSAENGVLYCKGSATDKSDKRADLITGDEYKNFELSIDWKISPKGNSGILYLVTEDFPDAHLSGPEYQIIDDVNFPGKLEEWQKTGANYAMDPAPTATPKPVGEWNTTRIVVNKGQVQHWLNGKKLLEFDMWTEEWNKKKMSGKWKDAPGYGKSKKGHIALQDHGSEAWFKNIKLKEL